jgi:HSP20 family protein
MNIIPWRSERKGIAPSDLFPTSMGSAMAMFREEMDRLFDRYLREPWESAEHGLMPSGDWIPAVDVSENEKEIVVRADVPGFKTKDLEVTVTGNVLSIIGRTSEEFERTEENLHHCERRYGSFRRDVELPSTADPGAIEAEEKNGVLAIRVKKIPGAEPKHVPVRKAGKEEIAVPVQARPRG